MNLCVECGRDADREDNDYVCDTCFQREFKRVQEDLRCDESDCPTCRSMVMFLIGYMQGVRVQALKKIEKLHNKKEGKDARR